MERAAVAKELIQKAQKLGFRLEMDRRLVLLRVSPTASKESRIFITEQVLKYLVEIRCILKGLETSTRARELIGRPILSPERGEGTLLDAFDDGRLAIGVSRGFTSNQTQVVEHAKNLVILLDDDVNEGSGSSNPFQTARKPARKGILAMFGSLSSGGKE